MDILNTPSPHLDYLAKTVLHGVICELINIGVVNPKGKTGDQIVDEVGKYVENHVAELQLIVDHTDDIVRQARVYQKFNKKELACLFYALYIEHRLNEIVSHLASRRKLPVKDIEALTRETSYKAKCSWLLHILGGKPVHILHLNRINKLMELRNSFVHYKWRPMSEQMESETKSVLENIDKTIKYLSYYRSNHLDLASKQKIRKVLKSRNKPF